MTDTNRGAQYTMSPTTLKTLLTHVTRAHSLPLTGLKAQHKAQLLWSTKALAPQLLSLAFATKPVAISHCSDNILRSAESMVVATAILICHLLGRLLSNGGQGKFPASDLAF